MADVFTRAVHDDPGAAYLVPDPRRRRRVMRHIYAATFRLTLSAGHV